MARRRHLRQSWAMAMRIATYNVNGINGRLPNLLLSLSLAGRLVAAGVDRDVRARERSSDHAPVWIDLRRGVTGSRSG